jgi:hypothetical protein
MYEFIVYSLAVLIPVSLSIYNYAEARRQKREAHMEAMCRRIKGLDNWTWSRKG